MDDDQIKIIFLGESGVGKSCLINRFLFNRMEGEKATTSTKYLQKNIIVNGRKYICNLWDTPGVEILRRLTTFFLIHSDIVVLVYDTTDKSTFLELQFWLDSVIEKLGNEVYLILVGNRSDLYYSILFTNLNIINLKKSKVKKQVKDEKGREFAKIIKAKFTLITMDDKNSQWNNFFENSIKDYIINYREKKK